MYHKLKIDAGSWKSGSHIFVNEDQAAMLIEAGRIEAKGHEVNPDEKEAKEGPVKEVIVEAPKVEANNEPEPEQEFVADDVAEVNPDEKEAKSKAGRKPKVSSTTNVLQ